MEAQTIWLFVLETIGCVFRGGAQLLVEFGKLSTHDIRQHFFERFGTSQVTMVGMPKRAVVLGVPEACQTLMLHPVGCLKSKLSEMKKMNLAARRTVVKKMNPVVDMDPSKCSLEEANEKKAFLMVRWMM